MYIFVKICQVLEVENCEAGMYKFDMDYKEVQQRIRKTNLEVLISEAGNAEQFSKKIKVTSSLISRYRKSRPIGEEVARKWELLCDKPPLWMDRVHGVDEELMSLAIQTVDEYIESSKTTIQPEKRRKLYALSYKLMAENGADISVAKTLVDIAS